MPITDTRNIIPFVNNLEARIVSFENDLRSWNENKSEIISIVPRVSQNRSQAISAIVKAEEALAELNTATFGVVASKGQRLKKLLDDLKQSVYEIAQNATPSSFSDRYAQEIDHAVSEVDSMVQDGLKLDYRLRQIQEKAQVGVDQSNKEIVVPYKHEIASNLNSISVQVPEQEGVQFIEGDVTVLNESGDKGILDANGNLITGRINSEGYIVLSAIPRQPVNLYFPVKMQQKNVPEDVLYFLLNTVVQKTSPLMEQLMRFEQTLTDIISDIANMKGINWTVDHSIMSNHQNIVKEAITPKGLDLEVRDGMIYVRFSYNDHPYLSHFVLERLDSNNKWQPYDGEQGIINK